MRIASRRVQLKKKEKTVLDIESAALELFRSLSRTIHPKKERDIVLREGVYTLVLGDIRMIETEDEKE